MGGAGSEGDKEKERRKREEVEERRVVRGIHWVTQPTLVLDIYALIQSSTLRLKLRFHLSVMRMQMTNANVTTNRKHRISTEVLPEVRI